MNLISTDTSRIEQAAAVLHLTWISVYQIVLTVALLVYNLGWAAAVGAAVLIAGLAGVTSAMRPLVRSRMRITKLTDERATLTQEVFQAIRFVKYFSFESFFLDRLKAIRGAESRAVRIMHLIRCAVGGMAQFLPVMATTVTFVVFASTYGTLQPATVFSSVAMLNLLRTPVNWIPVSANLIVDALQSLRRIEDYLSAEEAAATTSAPTDGSDSAIRFVDASFTWESSPPPEKVAASRITSKSARNRLRFRKSKSGCIDAPMTSPQQQQQPPLELLTIDQPFSLSNMNLSCRTGELVAIVGAVGAGKSSLLGALAGDMRQTGGTMELSCARAYCPQQAWIQNATVRENITFGAPFNPPLYWRVVKACALLTDFDILPQGDMTDIGERGITLSGGQKQRVSIARAIYSGAGIVLLDDPLSAVDANVGKHIFEHGVCGLLRDKTVFLATHHMHLLPRCDQVIWMIEGRIEARGTFEELMASKPVFAKLMTASGHAVSSEDEDEIRPLVTCQISGQSQKSADNQSNHDQLANLNTSPADQLVREESEIRDSVSLSVYVSWLRSSGSLWNAAPVLIGQVLFRTSSIVGGLWLSWWVDDRYGLTLGQNVSPVHHSLSRSMSWPPCWRRPYLLKIRL